MLSSCHENDDVKQKKTKENKNDLITTMAQFLLSAFLLAAAVVVSTAASNNWDFDFDFSGFSNKATLLVTDCSRDVIEQINLVLGGSVTNQCVEIPTTNVNLTHVSCVQDSFMGQAINFTLYKTDDEICYWVDRSATDRDESIRQESGRTQSH